MILLVPIGIARGNQTGLGQQRFKLRAPPLIAACTQRAQRIAVITYGDDGGRGLRRV